MMTWLDRYSGPLGIWLASNLVLITQLGDNPSLSRRLVAFYCLMLAAVAGIWWDRTRRQPQ